jgi:hypothetical protein
LTTRGAATSCASSRKAIGPRADNNPQPRSAPAPARREHRNFGRHGQATLRAPTPFTRETLNLAHQRAPCWEPVSRFRQRATSSHLGAAAAELREVSCWQRSPLRLGFRTGHDARRDFAVRVRLPDPALRADLRDFLDRWGCVSYEVDDDVIEVFVLGAPGVRQGRREFHLYLETWRAHHPGLELDLLD